MPTCKLNLEPAKVEVRASWTGSRRSLTIEYPTKDMSPEGVSRPKGSLRASRNPFCFIRLRTLGAAQKIKPLLFNALRTLEAKIGGGYGRATLSCPRPRGSANLSRPSVRASANSFIIRSYEKGGGGGRVDQDPVPAS